MQGSKLRAEGGFFKWGNAMSDAKAGPTPPMEVLEGGRAGERGRNVREAITSSRKTWPKRRLGR